MCGVCWLLMTLCVLHGAVLHESLVHHDANNVINALILRHVYHHWYFTGTQIRLADSKVVPPRRTPPNFLRKICAIKDVQFF